MNRKQKIIISVIGIFITLLILVGLTYAYFLTRIQGNTNTKSISVTTADLKLTYSDGNGDITATNILPGTTIDTKTFTVKNEGNATVNNYAVYLEELVNTLSRTSDMVYTLTCTSSVENKTCKGVTETPYPTQNGIIVTNNIDVGETQSYELKVDYKEMNVDQSVDMGKTISGKVQIYNLSDIVDITGTVTNATSGDYVEMQSTPKTSQITNGKYLIPAVEPGNHTLYVKDKTGTVKGSKKITINKGSTAGVNGDTVTITSDSQTISLNITNISSTLTTDIESVEDYVNPNSLKTHILSNAKSGINGTTYSPTPLTKPAAETSGENEKTLSVTTDDYGDSYYYRGSVTDNYVNFAGMCWKVVRIEGDGSIKLILEDQNTTCNNASFTGNWSIGSKNFGYTEYAANTLTASDGTKNSDTKYIMNYLNGETNNTNSLAYAFKSFQTSKLSSYLDKLKAGDWCLNDKAYATSKDNTTPLTSTEILDKQVKGTSFYYDSYVRLYGKTTKEPTLKCNGTNMMKFSDNTDMYVGTLTADEIVYAGGKVGTGNSYYYLINDYQKSNWLYFWSLAPGGVYSDGDSAFYVDGSGYLSSSSVYDYYYSARPAVSLKSSAQITGGNGTISNPYTIG